tara:strand:- start:813 stop:1031 length:219 start_codon:yes stop_codon:yes gene_type:complete
MKKDELIESLSKQYEQAKGDIKKAELVIQNRKEIILKIEGALEALNALQPEDSPTPPTADHTDAAIALGVFK